MRRRITLYIAGTLADLSDQAFLLFNYAFTDNENPTAVKNSWSQQLTLPGTPVNNGIFGHYYRPDRNGGAFNPLTKTPFAIFADTGEKLQEGYCRLDEVTRAGEIVTGYKVSLFGGLGSFFYTLSYRDDGAKLTLADLDYLAGGENELDFNITSNAVAFAWQRLQHTPVQTTNIWDILNFAPCYEGIPEGDFEADKMYGARVGMGLPTQGGYHDNSGYTLVKLSHKVDMWGAHDLRSYLQRPVVSLRGILKGIASRAADYGYVFDYSAVPSSDYTNIWKTLPSIPSLGTFRKQTGSLTATFSGVSGSTAVKVASWALSGLGSYLGIIVNASLAVRLTWEDSHTSYTTAAFDYSNQGSCLFCQLVAYAGGTKLGGSDVLCIGPDDKPLNPTAVAQSCGYVPENTPDGQAPAFGYYGCKPQLITISTWQIPGDLIFNLTATGVTRYELIVKAYKGPLYPLGDKWDFSYGLGGTTSVPHLFMDHAPWTEFTPDGGTFSQQGLTSDVLNYSTIQAPRSGAALGKATLLSSKHTPAEYLLSWAKLNGLVFSFDHTTNTVTLRKRDDFFGTALPTIDLSNRIDRRAGISIAPLELSAKWYDYGEPVVAGAFAQEYERIYGRPYGWQRVNTGYDFDAAAVDLFQGCAFRGAVSKLAHGPLWKSLNGGVPPVFFEAGHKYTLWSDGDGSPAEFDVPALDPSTSVYYYNATYNGYDCEDVTRLEFCDADGKNVDGQDVLCIYDGYKTMARIDITDDTAAMLLANDNKPCWLPRTGTYYSFDIPTFSRYSIVSGVVAKSLDMGTPQEVDVPGLSFDPASALYVRRWQAWTRDRLDVNTKVMRCKVNLQGLQVGPELLRRLWWYGGALWVLNKIDNYSLTTWDPADCEFVQVQDEADYNNGQN